MSSVGPARLPLYFEIPSHSQLVEKVESLSLSEQSALEGTLYTLAKEEKVHIEEWDTQWGKYHCFDCDRRLTQALLQRLKDAVQSATHCLPEVADVVVEQSPLLNNIYWNHTTFTELVIRAQYLCQLRSLRSQLGSKYPELHLCAVDSTPRTRGWKARETALLTLPICLSLKEKERFAYFTSIVEELIQGKYDLKSVELILDTLLERESMRPSNPHLESQLLLLGVKRIAESQIKHCELIRADESRYKDIFIIPNCNNKQAKFKPLDPCEASKEAYAYQCDRMLGIGLTAPTLLLKTKSIVSRLKTIKALFHSAENERGRDDSEVKRLREKAFYWFKSDEIPQEVRDFIFGEMFQLCDNSRHETQLGESLFFGKPGYQATDSQRESAITRYLASDACIYQQRKFNKLGSIQLWQNGCSRAYDYIAHDQKGGAKLKTASKTIVHFNALSGIIKGSMDGASENTLILDNVKGEVTRFWDIDDERSMPESNASQHIRLWQMGLPQCEQPFDKAFLLLFSDPTLIEKLKRIQSFSHITPASYKAQIERLRQIIYLFKEQLSQDKITLTPRELFFRLFGGQETFNAVKKSCNEDKSLSSDGHRISPIELFEFHLADMGKGKTYSNDWNVKKTINDNMYALYAPQLP